MKRNTIELNSSTLNLLRALAIVGVAADKRHIVKIVKFINDRSDVPGAPEAPEALERFDNLDATMAELFQQKEQADKELKESKIEKLTDSKPYEEAEKAFLNAWENAQEFEVRYAPAMLPPPSRTTSGGTSWWRTVFAFAGIIVIFILLYLYWGRGSEITELQKKLDESEWAALGLREASGGLNKIGGDLGVTFENHYRIEPKVDEIRKKIAEIKLSAQPPDERVKALTDQVGEQEKANDALEKQLNDKDAKISEQDSKIAELSKQQTGKSNATTPDDSAVKPKEQPSEEASNSEPGSKQSASAGNLAVPPVLADCPAVASGTDSCLFPLVKYPVKHEGKDGEVDSRVLGIGIENALRTVCPDTDKMEMVTVAVRATPLQAQYCRFKSEKKSVPKSTKPKGKHASNDPLPLPPMPEDQLLTVE